MEDSLNNLLLYDDFAEKYIEDIKNKEYSYEFAKNLIFLFKHKNQLIRQLVIETAIFLMKKNTASKKDLIPVIWMGLGDKIILIYPSILSKCKAFSQRLQY